ncbi:MAG: YqaJ viral recombinase family protein [Methylophilaceae bacterium]
MIIQGTQEWYAARLGKVTASSVSDVVARTKAGTSEKRKRYLYELAAERLTGKPTDTPMTNAMLRGLELEPQARNRVNKNLKDFTITEAGFYEHPTIKHSGASPDGLINSHGLLEIKCMGQINHMKFLAEQKIPKEHLEQIFWQQACMPERTFTIYVAFNPDFPAKQQFAMQKVHRDNPKIAELENQVKQFLTELDELIFNITKE